MPSHRSLRMAEAIREVVSSAILFEMADPRVRAVTVLRVDLTGDLRNATISVSIMGSEAEQKRVMKGLQSGAGFLQSRVAARLQTRFTPVLTFQRDDSVKKSIEMSRLIDDVLAADRQAQDQAAGPAEGDPSSPDAESDDADADDDDDTKPVPEPPAADRP
jgi:ribosome-binding factor A